MKGLVDKTKRIHSEHIHWLKLYQVYVAGMHREKSKNFSRSVVILGGWRSAWLQHALIDDKKYSKITQK